jgi:hypothetical protein
MKRRGLRGTLTAAALALAVVAVVVAFNWSVVRDHVEAWHFQLTRETMTVLPDPKRQGDLPIVATGEIAAEGAYAYTEGDFLRALANYSGCPVILDPREHVALAGRGHVLESLDKPLPASRAKEFLVSYYGCRVLEQRLSRRVFVVRRVRP